MTSSVPRVGIIYLAYPTRHWERDIDRAMRSFERLNYPKDRVELICVEPEKTEPRVKVWFDAQWMPKSGISLPRLHYVFNTHANTGFAENNNVGFEKAKELGCEYIHLTNEDTDVDPDYLLRAVECAESDPAIGAVQSLILLGEERDKINSIGNAYHYLGHGYSNGYKDHVSSIKRQTMEINYASGAAVLVRVSAISGILFDPKLFMYHEDTDLSLDLRMRGYKVVVEPKSVVYHYYEFGKSKKNFFWMERNRYVLPFSYYKPTTLLLLFPMFWILDFATLLFSMKSGWFREKLDVYREWLTPAYWRWIRERRRRIKATRRITDREFLSHAVSEIKYQGDGVKNPMLEKIGNPAMRFYWTLVKPLLK